MYLTRLTESSETARSRSLNVRQHRQVIKIVMCLHVRTPILLALPHTVSELELLTQVCFGGFSVTVRYLLCWINICYKVRFICMHHSALLLLRYISVYKSAVVDSDSSFLLAFRYTIHYKIHLSYVSVVLLGLMCYFRRNIFLCMKLKVVVWQKDGCIVLRKLQTLW